MLKAIFSTAIVSLLAFPAFAQTSNVTAGSGAVSGSTSAVIVGGLSGGPAGAGAAAAGGLFGSGILGNVGQTTGGNGVVSYDACAGSEQYTVGPFGYSGTYKIEECWRYRMMEQIAKFPPGTMQYEAGCNAVKQWMEVDWDTGTMACTRNKAKLAKSDANDPRAKPLNYVVIIAPNLTTMPATTQPQAQVAAPTATPQQLPRCSATITDRCRG